MNTAEQAAEQHRLLIRQISFKLYKAENGMGMPYSREDVLYYRRLLVEALEADPASADVQRLYYEAENINDELNQMNETELARAYAQRLMDRLKEIRTIEMVRDCEQEG